MKYPYNLYYLSLFCVLILNHQITVNKSLGQLTTNINVGFINIYEDKFVG